MPVRVRYLSDPACSWSWAAEPALRRLMAEFGDGLEFTWVMGGLARRYEPEHAPKLLVHWLDVAAETGAPIDPRLWSEGPLGSTYPACMAVKAAAQQAPDGGYAYLRRLREGIFCHRRKLDTTEALVEEARGAGLDVARFRIDLASHATVEAFGADLDEVRSVPERARELGKVKGRRAGEERVPFPTAFFAGDDGGRSCTLGPVPHEELRAAAEEAGARPTGAGAPGVTDALRRFGRMTTAEVAEVCDLPGPRAAAELWRLAGEWRVRHMRVLTGDLWELA